jgi:hypothetical protein
MTIAPQLPAAAEFNPTPAHHCEPDAPKPVPVWSCGPVDSGSLWRLPIALGRPLAVAVDTSAALAALPGRVIELVTVAEQTLTALRAVVVRTNALLEHAEGITATAEGILQAADRAANAAAGTVEQAHTTTDRVIALLGAYSDALNRLAPMVRRLADPKRRRCFRASARTVAAARQRDGSPGDPPAGSPRRSGSRHEPAA